MRHKVKIPLSLIILIVLGLSGIKAQDCNAYFPYKSGMTIGMDHFDKKDKRTGSTLQKVKEVKEIPGGISFVLSQLHKDEKDKELFGGDFEVSCQDGLIKLDMRKLLGPSMMGAYEGMEVQVEGDALEFPARLSVGQVLKGGVMNVTVFNQGIRMLSMQINIADRTVEAKEEITTPAGTFSCFKIAYETETRMLMKVKSKTEEWIAEGVGVVKTASYNANGKLESYSLLTKFSD